MATLAMRVLSYHESKTSEEARHPTRPRTLARTHSHTLYSSLAHWRPKASIQSQDRKSSHLKLRHGLASPPLPDKTSSLRTGKLIQHRGNSRFWMGYALPQRFCVCVSLADNSFPGKCVLISSQPSLSSLQPGRVRWWPLSNSSEFWSRRWWDSRAPQSFSHCSVANIWG